ncbi:MAG: hypothetical protein QE284_20825 [Rhizobium sp.]|nr:hypothetical protein [Rhizobium sp.]
MINDNAGEDFEHEPCPERGDKVFGYNICQFPNADRTWLPICDGPARAANGDHIRAIYPDAAENLAIRHLLVYTRPIRTDTLGGNVDGTGNGLRFWHG